MRTVSSVSGGRTSAYMAAHYPTDEVVFALVIIDHAPSTPKDSGLVVEIKKRIPNFIASHEDDKTLRAVLELEQYLGRSIKWVASEFALEKYCLGTTDLPGYRSSKRLFDSRTRFCTVEQKIRPIAQYLRQTQQKEEPVLMDIGFRFDEPRRVENWKCSNDRIKFPKSCSLETGKVSYNEVEWRATNFPLYTDRINKAEVRDFWAGKIDFPEISNCRFCPFHSDIQLQRQAVNHPGNLQWWLELEKVSGHSFGSQTLKKRLAQNLIPGVYQEESPCGCTD